MYVSSTQTYGVNDSLLYMGVLIILQDGGLAAKDVYDIYGAKMQREQWDEREDFQAAGESKWWDGIYGPLFNNEETREYDTVNADVLLNEDAFWSWVKTQLPTPKSRLSIDSITSALQVAGLKDNISMFHGIQNIIRSMLYTAGDHGISHSTKYNTLYLKVNRPPAKPKAPKPKTMTKGYCNTIQRAALDYAIEIVENWFGIKLTIQYATYDAQRDTFVKMGLSAEDILALANDGCNNPLHHRLPYELQRQTDSYFTGWWNSANKVRPVD